MFSSPLVLQWAHLCLRRFAISPIIRSMMFDVCGMLSPMVASFAKVTMSFALCDMKMDAFR